MTALKDYERLECMGLWRPSPEAQRRDVIVALGDATLTISAQNGTALAHWSLPALRRRNPGARPALFDPGPDAGETLEIDDALMIEAINRVRRAIERRRPRPGRLRTALRGAVVLLALGGALFWLPDAMISYTASVLPEATRAQIGAALLTDIRRLAGRPCEAPLGQEALARLQNRLFPEAPRTLVVLSSGVEMSEHLPGRLILLNRSLVEDHESPEVVAGFALVEDLRREGLDPMLRLLREGGLPLALRLLTTGKAPGNALRRHAETLLLTPPEPVAPERIIARFREARLPLAPYAYARDITGETTVALIEADALAESPRQPVLDDDGWVALQGICEG